jgi:hypothetical protein
MAVPFSIGGGITIGGGISAGPNVIPGASFTLSSSDFNFGFSINANIIPQGANGNEGFINTVPGPIATSGSYLGNSMTAGSVANISSAVTAAGLDPTDDTAGYVWNVSWAAGSNVASGLVKFNFFDGSGPGDAFFAIQTINPVGNAWQTPGNSGNALVGLFNLPATFTIYTPLINKGNIDY